MCFLFTGFLNSGSCCHVLFWYCCILLIYYSPVTRLPINVDLLVGGPANTQNGKIESARVLRVYYRLKNREAFDSGKGLFVSNLEVFIHVYLCR